MTQLRTTVTIRAHGLTRAAPGEIVNEDAIHVGESEGLFVVADGLAGRPAGAVASEVAVQRLVASHEAEPTISLADAFQHANDAVVARAAQDQRLDGMAAAVTGMRLDPGRPGVPATMELVHAGDCRAYLLRDGHLRMLTADHLVLRRGGRVITKVLGRPRALEPDTDRVTTRPGDRWLLCTDGLTKVVGDREIGDILADASDPVVAVGCLLDAARAAATPDDVTVLVVDMAPGAVRMSTKQIDISKS